MIRWLAKLMLRIALLLCALLVLIGVCLASDTFTRWVANLADDLVDGLTLDYQQGNIYQGIVFNRIAWDMPGLSVELAQTSLALDWVCISRSNLCVEQLATDSLRLNLDTEQLTAGSDPAEPEDLDGSELEQGTWQPPFPFVLSALKVADAKLAINAMQIELEDLQAAASWSELNIVVDKLDLQSWLFDLGSSPAAAQTTSKSKQQAEAKPTSFSLQIEVPEVEIPYIIEVADLDLRDGRLNLTGQEELIHQAKFVGTVYHHSVQAKQLSLDTDYAQLELSGTQVLRGAYASNLKLALQTNLLPSELTADIQAEGDGEHLNLAVTTQGYVDAELSGDVAWLKKDIPFNVLSSINSPYLFQENRIQLNRLGLDLSGSLQTFQMSLSGLVSAAHDLSFSISLEGDQQELHHFDLEALVLPTQTDTYSSGTQLDSQDGKRSAELINIETDSPANLGSVKVKGSAGWYPNLSGSIHSEVTQLKLSKLLSLDDQQAELPDLDGELILSLAQQQWQLAKLDLSGEWQQLPFSLLVQGSGEIPPSLTGESTSELSLNSDFGKQILGVELQVASNSLTSQVTLLGNELDSEVQLSAPKLEELPLIEAGAAELRASAKGPLSAPQVKVDLDAQALAYQNYQLEQLNSALNINLVELFQSRVELSLSGLKVDKQQVVKASLSYQPQGEQQRLALNLESEPLNAELQLSGTGDMQQWQGALTKGVLSSEFGTWQNQSDIDLSYEGQNAFLGEHCWFNQQSRLCLLEPLHFDGQDSVAVEVQNFDFAIIGALLPPGFTWQGKLNAQAQAQLLDWQVDQAKLAVQLPPGAFIVDYEEQQHPLEYQAVSLDAVLQKRDLSAVFAFSSEQLGSINANVDTGLDADSPINGGVSSSKLKLASLSPFIAGIDELVGSVESQIKLSGSAASPQVLGKVEVADATVAGAAVPLQIEQLSTVIEFAGDQANIIGGFNSAGRPASWQGEFAWGSGSLVGELDVEGDQLQLNVDPLAKLVVSPQLTISLEEALVSVDGDINVDSGLIKIRTLPASAVSLSDDVIVIDEEVEQSATQALALDIRVNLGENLELEALGLDTELRGFLNLKQQPREAIIAIGRIELYEGSFRAYGQNLLLERGWLSFSGPLEQPYLDISAIRDPNTIEDNVTVGIKVVGLADAPQVTLFSEPSMSQNAMVSYLIRGRGLDDDQTDNSGLATLLLSAGIDRADGLVGNVGNNLGLDNLSLGTSGSGDGTQVEVSAYILPGVQVRYGMGVFTPVNELTVRYEILPKLYVEAFSGLHSALDVYYEFYLD